MTPRIDELSHVTPLKKNPKIGSHVKSCAADLAIQRV